MTTNGSKEKPVVLMVDDDLSIGKLGTAFFGDLGYEVKTATTVNEAIGVIHEDPVSTIVAFVDIRLKSSPPGLELLHYIKSTAAHRVVPYVLSANESIAVYTEAVAAGAFGFFLKKPDDWERMAPLVDPDKSSVLNLIMTAAEDDLTGLYNFRQFRKLAMELLKTARSRGHPKVLSLLLIDVDDFKSINDTYGYQVGDNALKSIAGVLKENHRSSDPLCRRGDEFLLLLPDAHEEEALKSGRKLQEHVVKNRIQVGADTFFSATVSIGVGEVKREEIEAGDDGVEKSFTTLYQLADMGEKGLKVMRRAAGYRSKRH